MTRARNKRPVERYHDRVAGRYDSSYDDAYWQWHDALTWEHLKGNLPSDPSEPVLDLGCGTGKWGLKLLKSGFRVTFVDISVGMLEQVRQALFGTPDADRAEFVHADLMDLSRLPEGAFGLAVAMGEPIGCTEHPPRALKEISRRLRPKGVLVATFDNRLNALDYYLQKGQLSELETFVRRGVTHWLTRDRAERFPIHTYTPSQLVKLLGQAEFDVVDMVGKTVLPMRDYREMLADPETRRVLLRLERELWRDEAGIGRAAHLQVAARRRDREAR